MKRPFAAGPLQTCAHRARETPAGRIPHVRRAAFSTAFAALAIVLSTLGCAATNNTPARTQGPSSPPPHQLLAPPEPGRYLVSPQCPASPETERIARALPGATDVERLLSAMRYVGEHLAYDPAGNPNQFDHTSAALFEEKTLGGCSEFGLATLALCRAMGYPSRMVLTMNAKWLERNRNNKLSVPNGHGFVEVWTGGRWVVLDPTSFVVYDCWNRDIPDFPGNEIVLARADDFWTAGLTDVDKANAWLRDKAAAYKGTYVKPGCPELGQVDFDYAAAFANLGDALFARGKTALAKRLYRKSLEFAPDKVQALVGMGRCLLAENEIEPARAWFLRALELDPACTPAKTGLQRLDAGEAVSIRAATPKTDPASPPRPTAKKAARP